MTALASGGFTLTPNTAYAGPQARTMSTVRAVPFTSPAAEFDAVLAGAVDVGFIPLADVPAIAASVTSGDGQVRGVSPGNGPATARDTRGHAEPRRRPQAA